MAEILENSAANPVVALLCTILALIIIPRLFTSISCPLSQGFLWLISQFRRFWTTQTDATGTRPAINEPEVRINVGNQEFNNPPIANSSDIEGTVEVATGAGRFQGPREAAQSSNNQTPNPLGTVQTEEDVLLAVMERTLSRLQGQRQEAVGSSNEPTLNPHSTVQVEETQELLATLQGQGQEAVGFSNNPIINPQITVQGQQTQEALAPRDIDASGVRRQSQERAESSDIPTRHPPQETARNNVQVGSDHDESGSASEIQYSSNSNDIESGLATGNTTSSTVQEGSQQVQAPSGFVNFFLKKVFTRGTVMAIISALLEVGTAYFEQKSPVTGHGFYPYKLYSLLLSLASLCIAAWDVIMMRRQNRKWLFTITFLGFLFSLSQAATTLWQFVCLLINKVYPVKFTLLPLIFAFSMVLSRFARGEATECTINCQGTDHSMTMVINEDRKLVGACTQH